MDVVATRCDAEEWMRTYTTKFFQYAREYYVGERTDESTGDDDGTDESIGDGQGTDKTTSDGQGMDEATSDGARAETRKADDESTDKSAGDVAKSSPGKYLSQKSAAPLAKTWRLNVPPHQVMHTRHLGSIYERLTSTSHVHDQASHTLS